MAIEKLLIVKKRLLALIVIDVAIAASAHPTMTIQQLQAHMGILTHMGDIAVARRVSEYASVSRAVNTHPNDVLWMGTHCLPMYHRGYPPLG